MGYAKPTTARLVDQRARRRATQDLIEAHREEWTALFDTHRAAATVEADELAERARNTHPAEDPPRLLPGRRTAGQTPLDRIDVARCSLCAKNHDRNHVCPRCGSVPARTLSEQIEAVQQMAARGATAQQMAHTLRLPTERITELLTAPAPAPVEESQ